MNGNKFTVNVRTRAGASPKENEYYLKSARHEAGNKLYDILYSQKMPAVVDIEEKSILVPRSDYYDTMYPPENEFRIEITVTPVKYHDLTIYHGNLESSQYSVRRIGLWERISNWFSAILNH